MCYLKKSVEMFEPMEIAESIYKLILKYYN